MSADVSAFAVTLVCGPAWDEDRDRREQRAWEAHASFMDSLVADGMILLGGPVDDGQQTLHVVEAADADEIRHRLAQDPWADLGLLRIGSIQPWELWLDFRTLPTPPEHIQ